MNKMRAFLWILIILGSFMPNVDPENRVGAYTTMNVHQRFNESMDNPNFTIVGAYGTPVDPGWGSIANGLYEKNTNPDENFEIITSALEAKLLGKETSRHADLVFAFGPANNMNIVGKSIEMAKELYAQGDTASLNIRPGGDMSVEKLGEFVIKLYTGQLEYAAGTKQVDLDFIRSTGIPLSLDLEEMVRGTYTGGIPAEELADKVLKPYIQLMESYGYRNPIIIFYEIGDGSYNMVDNAEPLSDFNLLVVNMGFHSGNPEESFESKLDGNKALFAAYDKESGGCMPFNAYYLPNGARDSMSEDRVVEVINQDNVAFVIPQ